MPRAAHSAVVAIPERNPVTFAFFVDYAADKDSLGTVAGTAHVRVAADSFLDARLTAEQMVAALGVEPVSVEVA
jgi:hypothetical protein